MISLDDMLTPDRAATWLQMTKAEVLRKCAGRHSIIPKCHVGHKTIRISPRIVLAKFADDNGMKPEVISAALNLKRNL